MLSNLMSVDVSDHKGSLAEANLRLRLFGRPSASMRNNSPFEGEGMAGAAGSVPSSSRIIAEHPKSASGTRSFYNVTITISGGADVRGLSVFGMTVAD